MSTVQEAPWPEVLAMDDETEPETFFLQGHVGEDEASETAAKEAVWQVFETLSDRDPPPLRVGRRTYAIWNLGEDDEDELLLLVKDPHTAGAFPVTVVVDVDAEAERRRQKAAELAHAAELERFLIEWFPEAEEVTGHGYPVGQGRVRFRLPGLQGRLDWRLDVPGELYVAPVDNTAFFQLYGDRKRPGLERFQHTNGGR